jgi:hypothetical protein
MAPVWLAMIGAALAVGAAVAAPTQWRATPTAGVHTYRYEAREIVSGATTGYRTDYRLRSDGKGGAVAEVVRSATFDGKAWTPVSIDPACAKALDARPGELATVRLYPLTAERAKLGDAFLATCAPAGVFFPLTDILNVVLIQSSDRFRANELKNVGQSADFPGFSTSLDRTGIAMSESSTGGSTSLASVDGGHATLDWKPDLARINMVEQHGDESVQLDGTEHFAFRLTIDARSGLLQHAEALYDDLDVAVVLPNIPPEKLPRLAIKRTVSISRADD